MEKSSTMHVTETEDTITIKPCKNGVTGSCTINEDKDVVNGAFVTVAPNTPGGLLVASEPENDITDKKKFYIAVCDKTYFYGKKGKMHRLYDPNPNHKPTAFNNTAYDERFFGDKFVSDPYLAMMMATFTDRDETYDPKIRHEFFANLKFNEHFKVYTFDRYLTIGTRKPAKDTHLEKFNRGEYELILEHCEVQLLSTNVEIIDLEETKNKF